MWISKTEYIVDKGGGMKNIFIIFTIALSLSNVASSSTVERSMDLISKQMHNVCMGGDDMDMQIFMWGIASGVRFTQLEYSKGKDKFKMRDRTAVDLACSAAIKDLSNNRFSSKFKMALVRMFAN